MNDFINRDSAINRIKLYIDLPTTSTEEAVGAEHCLDILYESIPISTDYILNHCEVCGYSFKELVVFADACRKKGITEKEVADFSLNVKSAYDFVLDEISEQFDKTILGFSKKEQEHEHID